MWHRHTDTSQCWAISFPKANFHPSRRTTGNHATQLEEILLKFSWTCTGLMCVGGRRWIVGFGVSWKDTTIHFALLPLSLLHALRTEAKKKKKASLINMHASKSWNRWGKWWGIWVKDWRRICYRPQTNEDSQKSPYLCGRGEKHAKPTWAHIIFMSKNLAMLKAICVFCVLLMLKHMHRLTWLSACVGKIIKIHLTSRQYNLTWSCLDKLNYCNLKINLGISENPQHWHILPLLTIYIYQI